jgi:hypothetical protein
MVYFGRARFKLDIHTVVIALQACFGGRASLFDVKFLRDRTFSFSVTSSAIGFEICNLSKFSNTDFEFYVNLWGNGGPNWLYEEKSSIENKIKNGNWSKRKILLAHQSFNGLNFDKFLQFPEVMTKLMLLVQGILLSIILGILMHHWRI